MIEQGSLPLAYGCANLYICKEQAPRTEWHHSMSVSCNSRWVQAMYDIFSYQKPCSNKNHRLNGRDVRLKRTKMLHQDLRLAWSKHSVLVVQRSKGQCRRSNSVLVDVSCLQFTNEKGRFATEQVSHLPSTRMINQETSVVAANMAKRPIVPILF